MYKIALVGDRDSIYGLASAGIEIFAVTSADDAFATISQLVTEKKHAIIYVVDNLHKELEAKLKPIEEQIMPAIIPIPGVLGTGKYGLDRVSKFVERAVGADILFSGR